VATVDSKNCAKCGHSLDDEDKFCPNCGEKIEIAASVPIDQEKAQKAEPLSRLFPPTVKTKPRSRLMRILIPVLAVAAVAGAVVWIQLSFSAQAKQRREAELNIQIQEEKKAEAEKEAFLGNIDELYLSIVKKIKEAHYDDALSQIEVFGTYDQGEYKNLVSLKNTAQIGQLQDRLKSLTPTDYSGRLDIYREMGRIDPANASYQQKIVYYADLNSKQQARANSQLQLLSWHWGEEYDYAIAEGEVKNITGQSIESVTALVTWYDSNGNLITSDDALIDYNPLMPGQRSPFKVMARYNPQMKKASIRFKQLMGGDLSTYSEK
jgi:hypothetical protein